MNKVEVISALYLSASPTAFFAGYYQLLNISMEIAPRSPRASAPVYCVLVLNIPGLGDFYNATIRLRRCVID